MATTITRYRRPVALAPWSTPMDRLVREAFTWPRLFADTLPTRGAGLGLGSNLYETGDSYIMQVALPGVKTDELEITARENVLTLQGKTTITAPEGARSLWTGVRSGEFRWQATLPGEVDAEQAGATYADGILTVTLPKSERAKAHTIKVGATQPQASEGAQEQEQA